MDIEKASNGSWFRITTRIAKRNGFIPSLRYSFCLHMSHYKGYAMDLNMIIDKNRGTHAKVLGHCKMITEDKNGSRYNNHAWVILNFLA
jgi:hypothetical protein